MSLRDAVEVFDQAEPLHYEQVSSRELRSQSVYRLQVGIFGLCAMLLIIGLANIIMDRATEPSATIDPLGAVIAKDAPEVKKKGIDPLADIGVLPAADSSPAPAATQKAEPEPAIVP